MNVIQRIELKKTWDTCRMTRSRKLDIDSDVVCDASFWLRLRLLLGTSDKQRMLLIDVAFVAP